MRHTIATILISCREGINATFPATLYPPFTRTAETIKFLHGAAAGLRAFKRDNEAGIIEDIVRGIKRDGFKYLEEKIRESESIRAQVSAKLEDS